MARKKDEASGGLIQKLLDERKQIEQWLVRLEKAADRTPETVRKRVRGDYETRLAAVVKELQGYEADLRSSLREVQSRQADARTEEKQATEELAEAELRYAVGEFGDSEWSEKKTGILDQLIRIREDLGQAEEEISELEEVLGSIAAPAIIEEDEEEEEEAAAEDDGEPEIAELEELDVDEPAPPKGPPGRITLGSDLGLRNFPTSDKKSAASPRPTAPPNDAAKPQTEVFGDELAFLKALSDDGGTKASSSGATARAAPEPKPAPAPKKVELEPEPPSLSRSRPSVINQRTLKCGECGAMNLPTEWYCDRCGAELASL
ncbi:MAG: hypothetical protein OEY20_13300 [Gemmatimonadota bacterium]|nr:hypothetical protein [Gemmatimonadota bacterium]MDH5198213.1 hypothetical protein [Gemmatimonadota bacterium]